MPEGPGEIRSVLCHAHGFEGISCPEDLWRCGREKDAKNLEVHVLALTVLRCVLCLFLGGGGGEEK